jgi:hypothetical protein
LTAASTPITGGNFAVGGQTVTYTGGDIDLWSTPLNGGGTASMIGTSGANSSALTGSYSVVGGVATLDIPVTFSIAYASGVVTGNNSYTGRIVAVGVVPEPTSCGLLGLALASGCCWRRRRA